MSDIKLFRTDGESATLLSGESMKLEKPLQQLIEKHMLTLLGVHFLGSEYSTGKKHRGRIDSLGIDENGVPVIVEYKRTRDENVINQGLFYLDWLLDHRAEFQMLVSRTLGPEASEDISWENTRLVCIAGDFTRYDLHAVEQINRNIELIRYKRYGDELLLLELVNAVTIAVDTPAASAVAAPETAADAAQTYYPKATPLELLERAPDDLRALYEDLDRAVSGFGDDVQVKPLKMYIAYRRIKNFMCVEPHPNKGSLTLFLKVDPDAITLEPGFTRDVRNIGHYGTGDLQVVVGNREQLDKAMPLILQSYEAS
jgi:predicted transport protein